MPDATPFSNPEPTESRRRRYARSPRGKDLVSLTPPKMRLLGCLAELRFLSLPQLARLCCPSERRDLSQKSVRRHMRELFDVGLVDVLPVSRAALAPPDAPNNASLLYGSAPNLYAPTRAGLDVLLRAGLVGEEEMKRPLASYGPKNGLFLAHELAVRDVRVWLEECGRESGAEQRVLRWVDGPEAAIGLPSGGRVLPDAWFVYQVNFAEPPTVLVGLVEVDRGTERGDRRWGEKLVNYEALFADRTALSAATGYMNARILVFAPDGARRDRLTGFLAEQGRDTAARFWLTGMETTEEASLNAPVWRRPSLSDFWPLLAVAHE